MPGMGTVPLLVYQSALNSQTRNHLDRCVWGMVVTSGSLGGVMVSMLAWNVRDAISILALGTIFPIFITPTA